VGVPNEYLVNVPTLMTGVSVSELPFWVVKQFTLHRMIMPSDTYYTRLAMSVAQISEGDLSLYLTGEFPVTKTVKQ